MNILARMDDLCEKQRIELALPSFSVNLFYARDDKMMLWLAQNADIDAVVIGINTEAESLLKSVKTLKRGFVHIPYFCFYAPKQLDSVWNSQTLEQACRSYGASQFIIADQIGDFKLQSVLAELNPAASSIAVMPATAVVAGRDMVG